MLLGILYQKKLPRQIRTLYYIPKAYSSNGVESCLEIKDLYIDYLNDVFNLGIGRQYIKWGNATFFNPFDIINLDRDLLRPIDEDSSHIAFQIATSVLSNTNFRNS